MIKDGIKKEEYRDVKPYYFSRLQAHLGKEITVMLRNGYSKKSPAIKCVCYVNTGYGKPEWGAEKGVVYYVLHIKDIIGYE